jgi:hypothetical protein
VALVAAAQRLRDGFTPGLGYARRSGVRAGLGATFGVIVAWRSPLAHWKDIPWVEGIYPLGA